MLKVNNINYSQKNKHILKNISFSINQGDIVSIIGSNGAGKTTLLKILNGLIKAQSGSVLINNINIDLCRQKDIAKLISYVPQNSSIYNNLTVYEYAATGRYPYLDYFGSMKKHDIEIIDYFINITGLNDFKDRAFTTLSGGEMQRVMIASALIQEAKIMLLDEPASFLDPKSKDDINNLLYNINKKENVTIVMVTHDINYAIANKSKFLCLKKGELFEYNSWDYMINNQVFSLLYDMEFEYIKHNNKVVVIPK